MQVVPASLLPNWYLAGNVRELYNCRFYGHNSQEETKLWMEQRACSHHQINTGKSTSCLSQRYIWGEDPILPLGILLS